jgi:hypothetical protein
MGPVQHGAPGTPQVTQSVWKTGSRSGTHSVSGALQSMPRQHGSSTPPHGPPALPEKPAPPAAPPLPAPPDVAPAPATAPAPAPPDVAPPIPPVAVPSPPSPPGAPPVSSGAPPVELAPLPAAPPRPAPPRPTAPPTAVPAPAASPPFDAPASGPWVRRVVDAPSHAESAASATMTHRTGGRNLTTLVKMPRARAGGSRTTRTARSWAVYGALAHRNPKLLSRPSGAMSPPRTVGTKLLTEPPKLSPRTIR